MASTRQLAIIEKALKILAIGEEPENTLQPVMDYLIHEARVAAAGIIWRYDSLSGTLTAKTIAGTDSTALLTANISINQGIIGKVFRSGQSAMCKADKADKIVISGWEIQGLCLDTIACVPLKNQKVKYGVLTLLNPGVGSVATQSETNFFHIIAGLLAMTMEKADLIKELKTKEVLDSINRYKAALIPTLAHEMRTPLISIKGYSTALLMEDAVFTPEKQREFLEIIDRESDTLEGMIYEYLESSTIDAGTMQISLQPVRLARLAAQVAGEIGRRFPKHSLIIDFPPDFPLIDADPERILQVLRQLLDNAAKYSPNGGMIVLQGKIEDKRAIVSVADEGMGIAPEDLHHLFDRFFRAKSFSGTQILGTGLGLPISKAIIDAHGGTIWAESQPGQGSKFYFTLPLKPRREN